MVATRRSELIPIIRRPFGNRLPISQSSGILAQMRFYDTFSFKKLFSVSFLIFKYRGGILGYFGFKDISPNAFVTCFAVRGGRFKF